MVVTSSASTENMFAIRVKNVDAEMMQADIDAIWQKISTDRERLCAAPELIESTSPYEARQDAKAGVAETLFIAIVGSAAKEVVSALWKDVIWPALKRKYGTDIEEG